MTNFELQQTRPQMAAQRAAQLRAAHRIAALLVAISIVQVPMLLAMGAAVLTAPSLVFTIGVRFLLAAGLVWGVTGTRWAAIGILSMPGALVLFRTGHSPLERDAALLQAAFVGAMALLSFGVPNQRRVLFAQAIAALSLSASVLLFVRPAMSLVPPDQSARELCAARVTVLEDAVHRGLVLPLPEGSESAKRFAAEFAVVRGPGAAAGLFGRALAESTFWCPPASRSVDAWMSRTVGHSRKPADLVEAIVPGLRECFCQGADVPLLGYLLTRP